MILHALGTCRHHRLIARVRTRRPLRSSYSSEKAVTQSGPGNLGIVGAQRNAREMEKLDATNTIETLFDDLRRGYVAHDDGGNVCVTLRIITQDDELRGVRGDARDVRKEAT